MVVYNWAMKARHGRLAYERGFTIVELLIVIVVIAILAAITIVSYNGIRNRAETASSQVTARQVVEKIQIWNTFEGEYPTYNQLVTNSLSPVDENTPGGSAGPEEAKLGEDMEVIFTSYPSGPKQVSMIICTVETGGGVVYQDSTSGTIGMNAILWGGATSMTYGSTPYC